jgi:hypothetical protein
VRAKSLLAPLTVIGVLGATVVGGTGAAATPSYAFLGYAGGSLVRAADNTITSDLSAVSQIFGGVGTSDSNDLASARVSNLITTGAVTTSSAVTAIPGGSKAVSEVHTADVVLLGGAIRIEAIDTVSTVKNVNGVPSADTNTTLVGIKIAHVHLPVEIPKNFAVTIPGIATLVLNMALDGTRGDQALAYGGGLYLSLLKTRGPSPLGTTVVLNPTYAAMGVGDPSSHDVSGNAYGSKVTTDAGKLANVHSDPTAPVHVFGGTDGTITSSIAAVNLSPVLHVGAITDTARAVNNGGQDVETTSEIAGVNLLGGLIKADAINVDAHVQGPAGGPYVVTGTSSLANLVIDGNKIPINAAPNTKIAVGNLLVVTINQQKKSGNLVTVRALDIQILKKNHGLPAGVEIQVASATAQAH